MRTADDKKRAAGQVEWLVGRLRKGPVTNHELISQGLFKYTSRISDLRKLGYEVECIRRDGGLSEYRLVAQKATRAEQLKLIA